MLSNPQKALLKTAQRQAQLSDLDYRDVLETVSGSRTSTDPRLCDRSFDKFMGYMEAIYWRKVDKGELQHTQNSRAPFQERGHWAKKNTREENSRDRYMQTDCNASIAKLEAALAELGYAASYCATIRENVTHGESDAYSLHCYEAALKRTLKSKQAKLVAANPF